VVCDLILCLLLLKEKEDVSEAAPLRFGKIASDRFLLSFRRGGQEVRSQARMPRSAGMNYHRAAEGYGSIST